ncbi:MAG TPA: hypothetical protein VFQ77_18485 [Pseudonocardiaceae bacterium]|nr:hypothetical protein [Pseudonocardiaceae bacterium]
MAVLTSDVTDVRRIAGYLNIEVVVVALRADRRQLGWLRSCHLRALQQSTVIST